jgi:hypothetical protein
MNMPCVVPFNGTRIFFAMLPSGAFVHDCEPSSGRPASLFSRLERLQPLTLIPQWLNMRQINVATAGRRQIVRACDSLE